MSELSTVTDQQLADLLKEGNQEAFMQIYRRYERLLFLHAYKKLQNPEEARDVVSELFTNLWAKHESLTLNISLSGYLYTSLRNRIINLIAHKGIESEYIKAIEKFTAQKRYEATDEAVRYKELLSIIDQEIAKLPTKMRAIFEMSRMEQLSHKEIAKRMGLSETTIKKQVQNALKIIKPKITMIVILSSIYFSK